MRIRRHWFTGLVSLAVIVFLWAPLAIVAVNSVNKNPLLVRWGGFTTSWYHQAISNPDVRAGLRATMVVAATSTLLSLAIAVTGCLWWRRAGSRSRRVFDGMTYLRILLPEVVFATALFLVFTRAHFQLGTGAVIIGHTVWNSAYATLIVQARTASLDPALEDAAADLGANPWRVFRRVTLPSLFPAILAAGLLAFTFSFDDVVTTYFLNGTANPTLPVVILSMIRFRVSPEINAIGILVMLFTVTMFAVAFLAVSGAGWSTRRSRA